MNTSVVTTMVEEVAKSAATDPATINTLRGLLKTFGKVINLASFSTLLKLGVMLGIGAATAYLLWKRWRKLKEVADLYDEDPYALNYRNRYEHISPVDEILGKSYVTNSTIFDDMDPLARDIAEDVRPPHAPEKKSGSKKKASSGGKKRSAKRRPRITEQQAREIRRILHAEPEGYVDWARNMSKSYLREVDEAARESGLPTYMSIDDDIPVSFRRQHQDLFW